VAGKIRLIEKSNDLNRNRTHDLPAFNILPQPTMLPCEGRSLENIAQFKYSGTTVTNQNLIQGEIKNRLIFGNACYHSVQNLLSSHMLSRNIQN
jgi:hypothetical protein